MELKRHVPDNEWFCKRNNWLLWNHNNNVYGDGAWWHHEHSCNADRYLNNLFTTWANSDKISLLALVA